MQLVKELPVQALFNACLLTVHESSIAGSLQQSAAPVYTDLQEGITETLPQCRCHGSTHLGKGRGTVNGQDWVRPIRQKMPESLIAAETKP